MNVPPLSVGEIVTVGICAPSYASETLVDELESDDGVSFVAPVVSLSPSATVSGFPFASAYEPMMMLLSASRTLTITETELAVPNWTEPGENCRSTEATTPLRTRGVVVLLATPATIATLVVASESSLPAGVVGSADDCVAS